MEKDRVKTNRAMVWGFGGVGLLGVLLTILKIFGIWPFTPKGPPVIIVGGSMRGNVSNGWTRDRSLQAYKAIVGDNTTIYLKDVYQNGKPTQDSLPATNGFLIELFDSDPNYSGSARNAVAVCSFSGCAHGSSTTTDKHTVYIQVRRQNVDRLEEVNSGSLITELHFHNQHPGGQCDQLTSSCEGACDKISEIDITLGAIKQSYVCGSTTAPNQCKIAIAELPTDWTNPYPAPSCPSN